MVNKFHKGLLFFLVTTILWLSSCAQSRINPEKYTSYICYDYHLACLNVENGSAAAKITYREVDGTEGTAYARFRKISEVSDDQFVYASVSWQLLIGYPQRVIMQNPDKYVDVLQTDIQKESSLEQLANTLQLSLEIVKADYVNRESATKKLEGRKSTEFKTNLIMPNAELRAVLAVVSNIDFFPLMRGSLSADDFEDPLAKDMFITLEECYREDVVNYDSILHKLQNENLRNIVAQAVTSGEFSQNTEQTINDSIRLIRLNNLKKRRDELMMSIRQLSMSTNNLENQQQLNTLLSEKMNIDTELRTIKDKSR